MWMLVWLMLNVLFKIFVIFFMVLILMMLGVLFVLSVFNGVNDFVNYIVNLNWIRNLSFGEQGVVVFCVFINEVLIFGILMMLIVWIVVEILWWGSVQLWCMVNLLEFKLIGDLSGGYYN